MAADPGTAASPVPRAHQPSERGAPDPTDGGGAAVVRRRRTVAAARRRLVQPLPRDGVWGWLGPLLVAAVAGGLRFHRLGTPHAVVFDETYYAKDAYSLLQHGVEVDFVTREGENGEEVDLANERILSGDLSDLFLDSPNYVVHPPVGKWVIALGEWAAGMTPFGWRLSVAVLGTLSVLMVARIGRRLLGSTLLGCAAGLLVALDGMHFVHSRMALLDLILMTFVLGAFGALLVDRDAGRARLAAGPVTSSTGPWLGTRPWRLVAGVLLGLAVGTKWSGLYFLAVFGLMAVLWDVGARRVAGVARPWRGALTKDAGPAFASLVLVAVATYLASWTGWFRADASKAYGRDAVTGSDGWPLVPDALLSLWRYHQQVWDFHQGLSEPHSYESNPWGWLVLARSTSAFYEGPTQGEQGCTVESCSRAVTMLGTPAFWWVAACCVPVVLLLWAGRRDWRAGAALSGVLAGYLPWFLEQDRTIFSFYTVVFVPWLALTVAMVLGLVLGRESASPRRRAVGAAVVGAYLSTVAANFAYFYPVLAAVVVPYAEWSARMWWPSWI